ASLPLWGSGGVPHAVRRPFQSITPLLIRIVHCAGPRVDKGSGNFCAHVMLGKNTKLPATLSLLFPSPNCWITDCLIHVDGHTCQQNPQSSRQNSRPRQQIEESFLSCGSTSFRLKFARCCSVSSFAYSHRARPVDPSSNSGRAVNNQTTWVGSGAAMGVVVVVWALTPATPVVARMAANNAPGSASTRRGRARA